MKVAQLDENGLVTNVIEINDDADPTAWSAVPCPPETSKGWTYDGMNWAPPPTPAPDMVKVRAAARKRLREQIDSIVAPIRDAYPKTEVQTWDQQAAEAEALIADSTGAAPMIRAIAQALGQDPITYAQAVKAKADAYRALGAAVVAARQSGDAAIDAASTPSEAAAAVDKVIDQLTAAVQA